MSQIRFATVTETRPAVTIVSAAAYPKLFVSLGDGLQAARAEVHWLAAEGRSVGHLEENCPHCHLPMISKAWLPAAICPMSVGTGIMEKNKLPLIDMCKTHTLSWQSKVVEIPPSAFMLLAGIRPGTLFAIMRQQGKNPKKVNYRIFQDVETAIQPPFDVRPFVLKAIAVKGMERRI